jgi:N-acetyl-anhydromuramyl-L-alanine amidase AmpD
MIHLNGVIENLTPYNDNDLVESHEITWGATGINSISRHIVYVGGIDKKLKPKDTRTGEQLAAMERYVKQVLKKYPSIKIAGHNQFAAKACPSFDVPKWCKSIGISDKNIKK